MQEIIVDSLHASHHLTSIFTSSQFKDDACIPIHDAFYTWAFICKQLSSAALMPHVRPVSITQLWSKGAMLLRHHINIPVPGGFKLARNDLQAAILGSLDAFLSHALAADPPLGLQHRLNDVLAAAAQRHTHHVVLGPPQQALALQPLHHCLPHLQTDVGLMSNICEWEGAAGWASSHADMGLMSDICGMKGEAGCALS